MHMIHVVGMWSMGGHMAFRTTWFFRLFGALTATERIGLPMLAALEFVPLLAERLELLLQLGHLGFKCRDALITLQATRAWPRSIHDRGSLAKRQLDG